MIVSQPTSFSLSQGDSRARFFAEPFEHETSP